MGENQKTQCSKNEMRKEGDKIVAESVCKLENSAAKDPRRILRAALTPLPKPTIKSTYEPPLRGMRKPRQ